MPAPPLVPLRVQSDTQIYTLVGSNGPGGSNMREPNLNVNQKISIKTMADFKLRTEVKPIRRMDVSDAVEMKNDNAVKIPNLNQESQALAVACNRHLAPHLLLAALLEELCFIYVKDRNKAQYLFKILCERLSKHQVVAPLSHLDEMSGLRYQRRTMLNKLINAAMKSMEQGPSLLASPDTNFSLNFNRPGVMEEDIIERQTSRYKNEFLELGILGKGGFGSVFKARNYLDGREYAVKKVRFKHKNTDLELKLLREVKALANLQHANIVGYNAAWMEYDSPYFIGMADRSPIKDQKTVDSDSGTTDSVQFGNQDSMSLEFCLSDDKNQPDVKESAAAAISGGLAMNAKLFSTVHKKDMAHSARSKVTGFFNSKHTHLNENHNRSSEEDSVVFADSVRKLGSPQGPQTLHRESVGVQKGTGRSLMVTKNEPDSNYFPKDVKNQENNQSNCCYDERFDISTEAYEGVSTKIFPGNSFWNSHNVDGSLLDNSFSVLDNSSSLLDNSSSVLNNSSSLLNSSSSLLDNSSSLLDNSSSLLDISSSLLDNSSSIPQFHKVFFEDRHSNYNTTKLWSTRSVVFDDHRQNDSVGSVVAQETSSHTLPSLPVDDHIGILNTSQVHYRWCPSFTTFSEQKCPGKSSGVQLPPDFICLCQQAASSVILDLKQDHYLHQHQENVSLAKLDSDSCLPEDSHHCVLKTASQTQNLKLDSALSSLWISERETPLKNENVISTPFQVASASVIPKFTVSHSQYNKVNPDKTPFSHRKLRNNPMQSHASSQSQQVGALHEIKHGLNIFMSHASSIDEPVSKTFNIHPRADKSGNRQAVLEKRNPLVKVSFRNDSESDTEEVLESHGSYVFQNSVTLYIQMELCTFTLQEWLSERNSEFQLKGNDDVAMRSDNIRIFHQILQGVEFIHANGLIHRDLKPRNIFLSGSDLHVRIGDFGLATGDALKPGREDLVLSPLSSVTPLVFDSHTEGVGTTGYASPEQLSGSNYDFRSDMYSLGVMLYEMFHVFVTEMERVQEMQQLRRGNKCSSTFRKKWPLEADVVEALTNAVASMRPSAQDVLSSKLFLSHEQQVKMLQRQLLEQQKQMEMLQRALQEKDKIIAQLRRDQREKTLAEEFDLTL